MHICDKCAHFHECYLGIMSTAHEADMKDEVIFNGCPDYKELTIEQMFGLNSGTLSK